MLSLIQCEIRKIVKSSVFYVVSIVFAVLPALGLIKLGMAGAAMPWADYLAETLHTFSAILIIGFAFTTCWVFGREYTDKTINDLLVKPVSKLAVAGAKFVAITLWNLLLTGLMYAAVLLVGSRGGLTDQADARIFHTFLVFLSVAILTMFVSTISAFLANVTKGYLAPIGLIFLIVLLVNLADNLGLNPYIPWTIPALLLTEGAMGPVSIGILAATGVGGFVGTVAWWRCREQQ